MVTYFVAFVHRKSCFPGTCEANPSLFSHVFRNTIWPVLNAFFSKVLLYERYPLLFLELLNDSIELLHDASIVYPVRKDILFNKQVPTPFCILFDFSSLIVQRNRKCYKTKLSKIGPIKVLHCLDYDLFCSLVQHKSLIAHSRLHHWKGCHWFSFTFSSTAIIDSSQDFIDTCRWSTTWIVSFDIVHQASNVSSILIPKLPINMSFRSCVRMWPIRESISHIPSRICRILFSDH